MWIDADVTSARFQIDNFETLLAEVEGLVSIKTFSSWFQVDLSPFKQALVNTVCKWGDMFKQHLITKVTQRLAMGRLAGALTAIDSAKNT